jgi:hypothetical protein
MFYVELDVFSGRPNPQWPLSSEEAEDLLARIGRLAPDGGRRELPAALGYRGFNVYRATTGAPQPWLHVGRGVVKIAEHNQIRHCSDTEGIEELLRRQAIAHGYGALVGESAE